MPFPFLPNNPNCSGCDDSSPSLENDESCGKNVNNTDQEVYVGPQLITLGINNCDSLSTVIQKINDSLSGNTSTSTTTSTTLFPPTTTTTTTETTIPVWYYGTYEVAGGIVSIPDQTDIDISLGIAVINEDPNNPINVPFNSSTIDFLWFAIPVTVPIKIEWYVDPANNGDIGGAVSSFGNLFPSPVNVAYSLQVYNLYISNYRTNVTTMTIS